MNKEEEIRDSLEFCKEIYIYYEKNTNETNAYSKYNREKELYSSTESVLSLPAYSGSAGVYEGINSSPEEAVESRSFLRFTVIPLILCIVISFIGAKLLTSYVVQVTVVHGNSMEKTVSNEDKLLVGKLSYKKTDPKRFDIVVFTKEDNVHLIKRVIGLPGERVEVKNGIIYINGEELSEHYGLDPIDPDAKPVERQLGKDEFFVLGDNRLVSLDSRYESIGAVKKDEILGKALIRVYPFHKLKLFLTENKQGVK